MNKLHAWMDENIQGLATMLAELNAQEVLDTAVAGFGMQQKVINLLNTLKAALFPNLFEDHAASCGHLCALVQERLFLAGEQLCSIAQDVLGDREQAEQVTLELLKRMAHIRRMLSTDIRAAYEGDPAARSTEEILLSYPSIEAVSTYRIAHELYTLGLPMIPRIMTEFAHANTGIDIHPGATIGEYFFIDHGTGVVVGETCVIGNHVKLYQGVTLGAKSFQLDEEGNPIKGIKRHPNIEDNVVIYAGATILGGDVTIGHGSVIGGSAWITHSVEPNSMVYNPAPKPIINALEE